MSTLRPYQQRVRDELFHHWNNGSRYVMNVMPTRSGKTVVVASVFKRCVTEVSRAVAHRQELVGQISMTLAREGVHHGIIAPNAVIKFIVAQQVKEYGRSFYHSGAPLAVAGVDTLIRRGDPDADRVTMFQIDECHHIQAGVSNCNKWGKAVQLYKYARGAGWTATPCRADRRRLSAASGEGIFTSMVLGPSMSELMEQGYLCPYAVIGPPPSIDRSHLEISQSTGDYTLPSIKRETERSSIVGDIVNTYLKFAAGQNGLTFTIDVSAAEKQAAAFSQAGVPTTVISAKTPVEERARMLADFRCGILKQVCNVDVFSEGTDIPGVSCVSAARPTKSFPLFCQSFARMLTPAPGKSRGIYFDHVMNVQEHGLPDGIISWDLDGGPRRRQSGSRSVPVRMCENPSCFRAYESYSTTCPYCGHRPAPVEASAPEQVEGDLTMYGPDLLKVLRARAAEMLLEPEPRGSRAFQGVAGMMQHKNMTARAAAHRDLRDALAWWAGVRRDVYGDDDSTSYRRFYSIFGVDVLTAQTLPGPKARELAEKVREDMWR